MPHSVSGPASPAQARKTFHPFSHLHRTRLTNMVKIIIHPLTNVVNIFFI
jgi:hypothetical protein